ncbi:hypothetical protein Dimus_022752 [Dionaea muscipula]
MSMKLPARKGDRRAASRVGAWLSCPRRGKISVSLLAALNYPRWRLGLSMLGEEELLAWKRRVHVSSLLGNHELTTRHPRAHGSPTTEPSAAYPRRNSSCSHGSPPRDEMEPLAVTPTTRRAPLPAKLTGRTPSSLLAQLHWPPAPAARQGEAHCTPELLLTAMVMTRSWP